MSVINFSYPSKKFGSFHLIIALFALILYAFVVSGCSGGAATPQKALNSYADAVSAGNGSDAYDLMSATYKETVKKSDFNHDFPKSEKAAEPLRKATSEGANIASSYPFTSFDTVTLQLSNDGWKITSGLFHFYGQRNPREALVSFLKAVERKKYKLLLQFIPAAYAKEMNEEMIKMQFEENPDEMKLVLEKLKNNIENQIVVQGDQAYMTYGDAQVNFIKEQGVWKIEDID